MKKVIEGTTGNRPRKREHKWMIVFGSLCGLIVGWLAHDRFRQRPEAVIQISPGSAAVSRAAKPALRAIADDAHAGAQTVEKVAPAVTEPAPQTATPQVQIKSESTTPVTSLSRPDHSETKGALAGTIATGGAISGVVFLDGTPPPEQEILNMDPSSFAQQTNTPTTHFYLTATNGALADVVVYLTGTFPPAAFGRARPSLVVDHRRSFETPFVSAMEVGQTLILTNSDPYLHVSLVDPARGSRNRSRRLPLYPHHSVRVEFSAPEDFIQLSCDTHPWEIAYVSVFPHPFFAVTDKQGRFLINDVPPGDYHLVAEHLEARSPRPLYVEIQAGETNHVELTLKVPERNDSRPRFAGQLSRN